MYYWVCEAADGELVLRSSRLYVYICWAVSEVCVRRGSWFEFGLQPQPNKCIVRLSCISIAQFMTRNCSGIESTGLLCAFSAGVTKSENLTSFS